MLESPIIGGFFGYFGGFVLLVIIDLLRPEKKGGQPMLSNIECSVKEVIPRL